MFTNSTPQTHRHAHKHILPHTHPNPKSKAYCGMIRITSSRCYLTQTQALPLVPGSLLIKTNHQDARARFQSNTCHLTYPVQSQPNIISPCQRASSRSNDLNQLHQEGSCWFTSCLTLHTHLFVFVYFQINIFRMTPVISFKFHVKKIYIYTYIYMYS